MQQGVLDCLACLHQDLQRLAAALGGGGFGLGGSSNAGGSAPTYMWAQSSLTSGTGTNYATTDTYKLPFQASACLVIVRTAQTAVMQFANDQYPEWQMNEISLLGPAAYSFPLQVKAFRIRSNDPATSQLNYTFAINNGPTGTPITADQHDPTVAGPGVGGYFPIIDTETQGTLGDKSGTITTGGTAQNAAAINTGRRYLFILNPPAATETLWVSIVGTAVANGEATGSVALAPGQSFVWEGRLIPTNALSVVAATNGHKFTAYEV